MGSGRSLERSFDFAQDDMVRCLSIVTTRTCPNSALEYRVVVLVPKGRDNVGGRFCRPFGA
jgi:hypothetical protein